MTDRASDAICNDRWHTAVHEAGHAIIGRVFGMLCGPVSITADDDSAGHSICADPWHTIARWEQCDRFREPATVFNGRIMTYMAGAEAEIALLGFCEGGDGDDRQQIDFMIASGECRAPEARLRRATKAAVHRHISKIEALALALLDRPSIVDDDEIRAIGGLPPPPQDGPIWLAWQSAAMESEAS